MNKVSVLGLRDKRRKATNILALSGLYLIALIAIAPLFIIFSYVVLRGMEHLNFAFFFELPKGAGELGGGMANAIGGSLVLVLTASLFGIPWGIAAGIYLNEYKSGYTTKILRFVTDLLASIPSIVIGIFAYAVVVAPLKAYSALAGSFALFIIMIPIIARTTEEILKLMPQHVREAGLALGLPRWKVILRIVLPGCLGGVTTGIMLAIARISGETAPLLFTAFSNDYGFRGLTQPVASLPVQIYNYAASNDDVWRAKAWTAALVLVSIVFLVNLFTRLILKSQGRDT